MYMFVCASCLFMEGCIVSVLLFVLASSVVKKKTINCPQKHYTEHQRLSNTNHAGDEFKCSGNVGSSCSTHVKSREMRHIRRQVMNQKWLSDCHLSPGEQFTSYIKERTNCISMKWWWWKPGIGNTSSGISNKQRYLNMYTPFPGVVGKLLHINGKFTSLSKFHSQLASDLNNTSNKHNILCCQSKSQAFWWCQFRETFC